MATACTPVAAQQSDGGTGSTEGSEPDCTPLPAPYLVPPEITAPEWPFHGVVTVFEDYDATPSRIVVRFHDAVTRSATDIVVASATFPYWANVSATTAGVFFGPVSEYSFYSSRPGCNDQKFDERTRIAIPWGQTARILAADVESGLGHGQPLGWNPERFTKGATTFQIASEGRRVHLRAGDSTGSYELSGTGRRGSDDAPGYQRLHGYWDYLRGTDGEHLVLASWPEEPAAAPEQIYVLSLRTGEIVMCGILWDLRVEFVAPPSGGLLVDEPVLPPEGEIDLDDACQRDLDDEFFRYLADLPETAPRPPAVPRPVDLPDQRAPASSFHGIIHSYTARSREVFDGSRHVQFYDIDAGKLTEVIVDDFDFVGLERRLEAGSSGISIARHESTGTRVVLPWGGLPVLVDPQDRRFVAMSTHSRTAAPDHGADAARQAVCEPMLVPVRDGYLTVTGSSARYGGDSSYGGIWARVEYGDQTSSLLFHAPPEGIGTDIEVTPTCRSNRINPFRSGGDMLVLTMPWGEDDYGRVTHDLFYVFSLRTGELLACGIDDPGSLLAVIAAPGGRLEDRPLVLPRSGWLDTQPCSAAPDQSDPDCVQAYLPTYWQCGRILDLASIAGPPPLGWFTPAKIRIVEDDS